MKHKTNSNKVKCGANGMKKIKAFEPINLDNAKVLILGSAPGNVSLEKEFYYISPNNDFWKLIDYVCKTGDYFEERRKIIYKKDKGSPESEKAKKEIIDKLREKRIAIWDICGECYRKEDIAADNGIDPDSIAFNEGLLTKCDLTLYDHIFINGKTIKDYSPAGVFFKNITLKEIIDKTTCLHSSSKRPWDSLDDKKSEWNELAKYI